MAGTAVGENVSFDDFCEYILPYRIGDEDLVYWREDIYNRYNHLLDDVRHLPEAEDPLFAARVLFDSLKRLPVRFTSYPYYNYHVGPEIADWRSGNCREHADAIMYVYRALGIPCGCDQMLMRGDNNVAHFFNFVLDKEKNTWHFNIFDPHHPAQTYWNPKGKMYRTTFSLNRDILNTMNVKPEKRHPVFRWPLIKDVTSEYSPNAQALSISSERMYCKIPEDEIVYLCLSSWMNWTPVDWALYKNGKVIYEPVDGRVVFRLATYDNNRLNMISDPFSLDEYGNVSFFEPQQESEEVVLLHKFRLALVYPYWMIGGVFEASNDAGFAVKDTLWQIKDKAVRLWNVARIDNEKQYRYVQYVGAENTHCNVAEVAFYEHEDDSVPLSGKITGTPNSEERRATHDYTNVFDGDPNTSFDYYLPSGGRAGLDLGSRKNIRKIIYTARNHDNFIRTGHLYELFYDKQGHWVSAGKIKAESDSLLYHVPKRSLLYLRNHTTGKEERIFEYRNGEQVFW